MKFKSDSLYYIKFKDHSMDCEEDQAIICEVFGKCLSDYEDRVIICAWDVLTDDEKLRKDNQTRYAILKSCIVKRKTLR